MKATLTWDGRSWVGVLDCGGTALGDRPDLIIAGLPELAKLMTGTDVPAADIQLRVELVS
jgi:hypothetical protein